MRVELDDDEPLEEARSRSFHMAEYLDPSPPFWREGIPIPKRGSRTYAHWTGFPRLRSLILITTRP